MCGRYATTHGTADLTAVFDAVDETGGAALTPDYNVAPTDLVPIVRVAGTGRIAGQSGPGTGRGLAVARWGLLPHRVRDPRAGARMINARAETVATSRAYAESFARRRCLVPADGWYEWLRGPTGRKQAYFMTRPDGGVLAFAGVWTPWGDRLTCSIITTAAVGHLAGVHDRMPLVLPPGRWDGWLAGPADPVAQLATAPEAYLTGLEIRPVGPAVGDVRNDGPALVARVDAPVPGSLPAARPLF
jgi:putative SOS response-associated peptidase YedK